MDRIEAAAKGVGAHIFARVDYQELSKKVKVEIRPNQLLIFGRGAGGPYIIKEAPLAGIDIPFKALVWEDSQGKLGTPHQRVLSRHALRGEGCQEVRQEHRRNHRENHGGSASIRKMECVHL